MDDSNVTVDADELIDAYKKQLGESLHQILTMTVALNKMKAKLETAQGKIRELELAFGAGVMQADQEASPERPRNPQRARQVAPGLNGTQQDGEAL